MKRRAFLVRESAKLMTRIRGVLAYEGVRPPKEYGLFEIKEGR